MHLCKFECDNLQCIQRAQIRCLQKPNDTAGDAGTRRSGLETLLGPAATEIVGIRVNNQGSADRTSNTHQAQVMIHAVDARHSVLSDLNIAEIANVT